MEKHFLEIMIVQHRTISFPKALEVLERQGEKYLQDCSYKHIRGWKKGTDHRPILSPPLIISKDQKA